LRCREVKFKNCILESAGGCGTRKAKLAPNPLTCELSTVVSKREEFRIRIRHRISALAGGILFLGTLLEAWRGSVGFYKEYYQIPKEKYGILTPLRWQDVVFLSSFFMIVIEMFFLSSRLLKLSLRRAPAKTDSSRE
jgi:hypothetical protein